MERSNSYEKLLLSGAVAVAFGSAAQASHRSYYDERGSQEGFADYARVEHVEPVVREITLSTPHQECWQEEVRYVEPPGFLGANSGLLLGGVLGGLIGGEIGHGTGRTLATIGGSLLGATIGYDYQQRYHPPHAREYVDYEDSCRTIEEVRTEERIEAYDVTYRYHGQRFHTRLPYDPGERIRVGVDVRPLEP